MVIDSGIFIEHLRIKNKAASVLSSLPDNEDLYVSAISLYELYMGATDESKAKDVFDLTDGLPILAFTDKVAIKASQLYHELKKQNKLIEFRDIFIAATCLVNQMPLATLNKKHFERIPGLKLI